MYTLDSSLLKARTELKIYCFLSSPEALVKVKSKLQQKVDFTIRERKSRLLKAGCLGFSFKLRDSELRGLS